MASSPASLHESSFSSSGELAVADSETIPVTSSNKPSLADSVANSPLFKLPPELRNRIYGYVFGGEGVMLPDITSSAWAGCASQWDIDDYDNDEDWLPGPDQDRAVQTSILSVCQIVNAEAIEVLYDTKIIRGWPIDLDVMLESNEVNSRVRRIEITGLLDFLDSPSPHGKMRHAQHLRDLLERLQRLPRVRSILILSDCLTSELYRLQDSWITVMDFVWKSGVGPATCVNVGRYQLHGKFQGVQIVNSKLVEMWPSVRDTPENYDGFNDALAIIKNLGSSIEVPNVSTWASHTSLRCWVDIQQQFLGLSLSGEWARLVEEADSRPLFDVDEDYTDDMLKYDFFRDTACEAVRTPVTDYYLLRSRDHVLRRLGPNDSSDVLDAVSQFMAVNIAGYNHYTDHPLFRSEREWRPIEWKAKGDSTKNAGLEYMAGQQSIALSGGASNEFVLDPSLEHFPPALNLIERKVFSAWIQEFDFKRWMDGTRPSIATPLQTKQLTYLHLAVLQPFSLDSDDQHRRDNWSKGLLGRYMTASGRLSQDVVSCASLADLRMVISIVLNIFDADRDGDYVRLFSSTTALPSSFDNDVYPGLAWRYGKLLTDVFKKHTSHGSIAKTLAQQYMKEGTARA